MSDGESDELWRTAIHEAGHAVFAAYWAPDRLVSATIALDAQSGNLGAVVLAASPAVDDDGPEATGLPPSLVGSGLTARFLNHLSLSLAGCIAERMFVEPIRSLEAELKNGVGASGDFEQAFRLLDIAGATEAGKNDAVIEYCHEQTVAFMEAPQVTADIGTIARALMKEITLARSRIFELLGLPRP